MLNNGVLTTVSDTRCINTVTARASPIQASTTHCRPRHTSSTSKVVLRGHNQVARVHLQSALVGAAICKPRNRTLGLSALRVLSRCKAVLLAPSESSQMYTFDGGLQLTINVTGSCRGAPTVVELKISNCFLSSPILHWGLTKHGDRKWWLPSKWPEGSHDFHNQALQTSFHKSGDIAYLTIEIHDKLEAMEFLLRDGSTNQWFKFQGDNFHLTFPEPKEEVGFSDILIPEELVQVQAYLRWERKGKQMYSADQEVEEYEQARKELQEEVSGGVSIETLRACLTNREAGGALASNKDISLFLEIPDDLVKAQSYVRWEKAGKPNYNAEEQLKEFQEARKYLQKELESGVSLESLYKKLLPDADIDGKKGVNKYLKYQKVIKQKIERKTHDFRGLITEYNAREVKPIIPTVTTKAASTPLENAAQRLSLQGSVHKKLFKLGDNNLLVLVHEQGGRANIIIASDIEGDLVLHWAVSRNSQGEWQMPPQTIIPPHSTPLEGSCNTPFVSGFAGVSSFQSLDITVENGSVIGIPFVLRLGETWMKNNGSDFYISLEEAKEPRKIEDGKGTAAWILEKIAAREADAERSLMHRFNIATDLTSKARNGGPLPLVGILVWMRFMATRQLTWNKNYNVKPREISSAQDRLTGLLRDILCEQPEEREIIRIIMSIVGRGGQGDVGQRIRDEILVIQRKNDCKGGMMEEWHQKLHNNTSPDDIVICEALLNYLKDDLNINSYWKTLKENGITKERLASYDRPIVSEPTFRADQKGGLICDLKAYLRTLKVVHSGADLESAIATCMGYSSEGEGFMGGIKIKPVGGLSTELPALLEFVLDHVEDKAMTALLEALVESRWELEPSLSQAHERLQDIIFLDLALDSTVRTAVERSFEGLINASAQEYIYLIGLVLENLCLSTINNRELVFCLMEWNNVHAACKSGISHWPLRTKAVLDRTRLVLADKAEQYHALLQPSAQYLGRLLGVDQWAVDIFTEEIIRSGSAAALSQLLNRLDPILRSAAHLGSWQIISPVEVQGYVEVVNSLGEVQGKSYDRPTILVSNKVKGEEEIPDGVVAVLTADMPDILSHVSVRARNGKVCFATCFEGEILNDLQSKKGLALRLQPTSSDLVYNDIRDNDIASTVGSSAAGDESVLEIGLKRKSFVGKFAITAGEFNNDLVGAKSRNIAYLKGKLPSWIKVPTSVAIPFGAFEAVLSETANESVAVEVEMLNEALDKGEFNRLHEIRDAVLQLHAPHRFIEELKTVMKMSKMPWPGDEGIERWEQAWTAIKKVWASKWNERAFFSTRKARIDHNDLCMAVLVQEIVQADYAFVIHTTNPSNGDSSEIYAEVVKGLGETLVGAYSGRALSYVCKKKDLQEPLILGFPSKRVGLFIKQSIIFRSDSNGEDLEGYAGAGLYDSVPMDEEEEMIVDYSSDPMIIDQNFQKSILSKIAEAGAIVEKLYGSAQDIEGVIKDAELFLVQTRPQM